MHFTCEQCGAAFSSDHLAKFCSRGCSYESQKKRTRLVCKACSKPFEARASALRKCDVGYCSRECYEAGRPRIPLEERFWQKVDKRGPDDCWLWTGALNMHGYGKIGISDELGPETAHRLSYEWAKGPIPAGLQVNHTCDVRNCVNPAHLYAGTAKDNTRDAIERGRWYSPFVHGPRAHS